MQRQLKLLLILLIACLQGFSSDKVAPTPLHRFSDEERTKGYLNSSLIVVLKDGVHQAAAISDENTRGFSTGKTFSRIPKVHSVAVPSGCTPEEAKAQLEATGLYEAVQYDRIIKASTTTPNDPHFTSQWALNNTGTGGNKSGADIKATSAWDTRTDASSVIVAIIDSGITTTHPDLAANLWTNSGEVAGDGLDNDGDGYIDDVHGINAIVSKSSTSAGNNADNNGHGTHVAGIIGAVGNNGVGVAGVAWKVQLMSLKFLDSNGEGSTTDSIECVNYAIAHGANVINASYGADSSAGMSTAEYNAINAARTAGIIMVVAAGNSTENLDVLPSYPAAYALDNIVTVGNTTSLDDLATSSSYGQGLCDLFAPGSSILSTSYSDASGYEYMTGTSMATPYVTGAIALLKAQFPSESYRQLINRLLRNVDTLDSLSGYCQTGGRLNLYKAITSTVNRPFNDDFSARAVLHHQNVTVRNSNIAATRETNEPTHGVASGSATLWWEYTATTTTTITLNWAASKLALGVAVYTGDTLSALTQVAANTTTTQTSLSFSATAGTAYKIAIDSASTGTISFKMSAPAGNDNFANATSVSGLSFLEKGNNANTTAQSGDPTIAGIKGNRTVWYKWTAPSSRYFQVSANSSTFSPDLGVYTGTAIGSLTTVASKAAGSLYYAMCSFTATAGTTYYFCVDSSNSTTTGDFILSLVDSDWQYAASATLTSSPAVASDGTVYIGDSVTGFLYSINADGTLKWKRSIENGLDTASIAVDDSNNVYFSAYGVTSGSSYVGYLYSVSSTNALRWKKTMPYLCASSPAIASDGTVYARTEDGYLLAIDGSSSATKWTYTLDSNSSYAGPIIGSNGTIYIGDGGAVFHAVNASTGTAAWTYSADGSIYTSAAIDSSGNVYFATTNGSVYSLTSAGALRWKTTFTASITSSPAISSDGVLYIAGYDKMLHALNISDGSEKWSCDLGDEVRASSPAIASDGSIYIGCYDGKMYEISAAGNIRRSYATGALIRSSPAIYGNRLYFGSNDYKLYAITLDKTPATSGWPMRGYDALRQGRMIQRSPAISTQPTASSVLVGNTLTLSVTASGSSLSYQWYKDGVAISGATSSTYTVSSATSADAGSYTVVVSNSYGSVTSSAVTVTVSSSNPGRITNMSVRALSQSASEPLIVGFVLSGNTSGTSKPMLVRGVGPGLASISTLSNIITDPVLDFYKRYSNSDGSLYYSKIASNDNWGGTSTLTTTMSNLGAFALSSTSKDAALLLASDGVNTAFVYDSSSTTGIALAEFYDADTSSGANPASGHLTNISARAQVGTGDNVLIAGFVISGNVPVKVLVRGVGGTTLTSQGVSNVLADPTITLYKSGSAVASNDNWGGDSTIVTAAAKVGATALPTDSKDAVLLLTLEPGIYSAIVSGVNSSTGVSLVEVYLVE